MRVESLAMFAALATVTTGGARGDTNWAELAVAAGEAGEADVRMVESGGGAGATKPARDTTVSVLVPKDKQIVEFKINFIPLTDLEGVTSSIILTRGRC